MFDAKTRFRASDKQMSTQLKDDFIILGLEDGVYYELSAVGAIVWQCVQTTTSLDEICQQVMDEYDVDRARCEEDIIVLLKDLVDRSLVDIV